MDKKQEKRKTGKKSKKKKKSFFKTFIFFIIFEIIFTGLTILPYGFYGPFKNFRNNVVSILMGTGTKQYIAKLFFSDAEIAQILKEQSKVTATNVKNVKTKVINVDVDKKTGVTLITDIKPVSGGNYTNAYALIISDPKRVKVGVTSNLGYVGQTTHDMARKYNAVAAINGGMFQDTTGNGTGGVPSNVVISNGKIVYPTDSTKLDDEMNDVVSIDKDGNMKVGTKESPNELIARGVTEAVSSDPYLIKDGKNYIEEGTNMVGAQPRTIIGQRADKSIIFLVIDGRHGFMKMGATLQEAQQLMKELQAVNAVCMDGGGSSTIYYNGEVINKPSSATGERAVPDIFYVAP